MINKLNYNYKSGRNSADYSDNGIVNADNELRIKVRLVKVQPEKAQSKDNKFTSATSIFDAMYSKGYTKREEFPIITTVKKRHIPVAIISSKYFNRMSVESLIFNKIKYDMNLIKKEDFKSQFLLYISSQIDSAIKNYATFQSKIEQSNAEFSGYTPKLIVINEVLKTTPGNNYLLDKMKNQWSDITIVDKDDILGLRLALRNRAQMLSK